MITSPSLRVYAADEQGSSGGDSGGSDGGGDSGGDSGGGSSDGGDNGGGGSEDNSKESDNSGGSEESNSQQEEDKPEVNDEPKNPDDLKGTPEEQEEAAVQDYIHEEPGIVKPYPPVIKDPTKPVPNEPVKCKDGKWTKGCTTPIHPNPINPPIKKCVSKWDKDCKPDNGNWCKQHPGKCGDGCKEKWHQDWAHNGKCGGHDGGKGDGHHHNDWCDSHNCHNHHHHSSTHFSDNHKGDVTVKVNVKYDETNSNNLEDVHLIIGDVYEKSLDLGDKPDQIKVDNLDIDGGDSFAVCLANEDSDEGDCVVTEADNDHATETVKLTVL